MLLQRWGRLEQHLLDLQLVSEHKQQQLQEWDLVRQRQAPHQDLARNRLRLHQQKDSEEIHHLVLLRQALCQHLVRHPLQTPQRVDLAQILPHSVRRRQVPRRRSALNRLLIPQRVVSAHLPQPLALPLQAPRRHSVPSRLRLRQRVVLVHRRCLGLKQLRLLQSADLVHLLRLLAPHPQALRPEPLQQLVSAHLLRHLGLQRQASPLHSARNRLQLLQQAGSARHHQHLVLLQPVLHRHSAHNQRL